MTPADGYETAGRVLKLEQEPTALISCSDMVVPGMLRKFYEEGKRIPQDLSLSVIQDELAFEYYIPKVTAVRYPNEKLGRLSAEFLFRKIQEEQEEQQKDQEEHQKDQEEHREQEDQEEQGQQARREQEPGIIRELLEVELIERESTGKAAART